jgi:hypothetical protein
MAKIASIFRDIEVMTKDLTSPEAKSKRLAEFAAEKITEARAINRQVSGRDAPYAVAVDGRKGAALSSVRPDGVIVANFDLEAEVLEWIGEQLLFESPRLTGKYQKSHRLFVDNVERDFAADLGDFEEAAFLNIQPYARKIEKGLSDKAPEGVYQAVAAVASKRFGNVARIRYSFRSIADAEGFDSRQPAIIVRPF